MSGTTVIRPSDDSERSCPLCGAETEVIGQLSSAPLRECSECDWVVAITGPTSPESLTEKQRITRLEREVERLRKRVDRLERGELV